jgi:imidazolonepropionase
MQICLQFRRCSMWIDELVGMFLSLCTAYHCIMKKVLIKNIRGLLGVHDPKKEVLKGKEMNDLPQLQDAWLAIENGKIADFGLMSEWPGIIDWRDLEIVEADGRYVLPTWCDSHTHIVFAGSRVSEFEDRIHGLTYEEIAAKGGGIINSARKLQEASENELFEAALKRMDDVMHQGTGAVEIKSGYGLTVESELKMLRVIRRLADSHPLTVKATFLGAHAFPPEFKDNPDGYVDLIIREMIPEVARQGLAEFIDIFCEKNYFSVEQSRRILEAGLNHGLIPKTHVNQFNSIGGVRACVELGALSVDHLEVLHEQDVTALIGSNTIPVALPGCSLFIRIPYTPARTLIDAGLPLALATDFNPGSTPSGNMNLVNSLACINMGMTPNEVINASTLNGAYAMNLQHTHGSIVIGKSASLIMTRPIHSPAELMYAFGTNNVERVFLPA